MESILGRDFFSSHVTEVARNLLGQNLIVGERCIEITETEAYRGSDDPASHAYRGPTPRAKIMFGTPGFSYVYLIYGMYYCLNVVTEEEGAPSGVLIRGGKLLSSPFLVLDGPGKLCKGLNITKHHHGLDMTDTSNNFYFKEGRGVREVEVTPRIGIRNAKDKLWRFVTKN